MRKLFQTILKILAKQVINRYQPIVVGITGSVGKTIAKEAIYSVLSRKFYSRKTDENFNSEFGVPLIILGIDPRLSENPKSQVPNFKLIDGLLKSIWLAWGWPRSDYPEILVLELTADRLGDIGYLVDIVKPKVGVITAVGEMPVHAEFYASSKDVAREKLKLIECLPADGLAAINYDDQTVLEMKDHSRAKVTTFGFSKEADVWISDTSFFVSEKSGDIGGLSFKINHGNSFIPARINNLIAKHQLYGILAAVSVGLHFGINLIAISEAIENVDLPKQRMVLKSGIKNSLIIDDTYNASPLSTHAALDTLKDFAGARQSIGKNGRRVAVLGNMLELGKYEVEAHRAMGDLAGERCDILVTVGSAAKLMGDSAANQMKSDSIFSFSTSEEAAPKVKEIIKEGDSVLVKGSRSVHMEKVVAEIEKTG